MAQLFSEPRPSLYAGTVRCHSAACDGPRDRLIPIRGTVPNPKHCLRAVPSRPAAPAPSTPAGAITRISSPKATGAALPACAPYQTVTRGDAERRIPEGLMSVTALIEADELVRIYEVRRGLFGRPNPVRAGDGISLAVMPGETLGNRRAIGVPANRHWGGDASGARSRRRPARCASREALCEIRHRGWGALRAKMQLVYQDRLRHSTGA